MEHKKYVSYNGRIIIVGCGAIGQGVLPLILRHIALRREQLLVIAAEERGREVAADLGAEFRLHTLTPQNYRMVLEPLLQRGDFLLNLSVNVSSLALIELAQEKGALYLDTCIEPWSGGYNDPLLTPAQRSNYALREQALTLASHFNGGPTAVLTHGANPGLVSHFVKEAILTLARDLSLSTVKPRNRMEWAKLAHDLSIKVIHISERDTQVSEQPKMTDEFVNTWSIDGFVSEGGQPAELGWGTHERHVPEDGRFHDFGCNASIYLMRPGAATRVRTWTPMQGAFHGFLVTHNESISIADYFSLVDDGKVRYRPTVHYAYHPCDSAVLSLHELAGNNWTIQSNKRLMMKEISEGVDELGVLLMGHDRCAYWYGSRLSIDQARELAPYNNATSLQVTTSVVAGMIWAIEHPELGIIEADSIDHDRILEIARPYLGEIVGVYSNWTPLSNRSPLFPEEVDKADPWQFKNFRVH